MYRLCESTCPYCHVRCSGCIDHHMLPYVTMVRRVAAPNSTSTLSRREATANHRTRIHPDRSAGDPSASRSEAAKEHAAEQGRQNWRSRRIRARATTSTRTSWSLAGDAGVWQNQSMAIDSNDAKATLFGRANSGSFGQLCKYHRPHATDTRYRHSRANLKPDMIQITLYGSTNLRYVCMYIFSSKKI